MADDDVAREIEELRSAYRAGLPQKIDALGAAIADEDRDAARALAHRLRGTSGSYGLPAVSAIAGAIEDALDARVVDWGPVQKDLDRLRQAVTR